MPYFDFLLDRLEDFGEIAGCTEEEITAIESQFQLQLPEAYKDFLRLFGRESGHLLEPYAMTIDNLQAHKDEVTDMYEGTEPYDILNFSQKGFFFGHMDDMLLFFICNGDDDPAVYLMEAPEDINAYESSFTRFIELELQRDEEFPISHFLHSPVVFFAQDAPSIVTAGDFKDLAIRARVAFGICCLEYAISHFQLEELNWALILPLLWSYTADTVNTAIWGDQIAERMPSAILSDYPFDRKDIMWFELDTYEQLQQLYRQSNETVNELIYLVFRIGTQDLHTGVSRHSAQTLNYLQKIIRLMHENRLELPVITPFRQYPITEYNGWGRPFTREDLSNAGYKPANNLWSTTATAIAQQAILTQQVIRYNDFPAPPVFIAGADVEYDKYSDLIAGAIVVLERSTLQVVAYATHCMQVTFPYIPGLFSFREMPPLLAAWEKLSQKPDLIICDGHGIAHPRRFGLACHMGVTLNLPAIGCGKTRLCGHYAMPAGEKGASSPLLADGSDEVIGAVLRSQTRINPIFVSIGHKIDISTATSVVLDMCREFRLPETTRIADQYAREAMEAYKAAHDTGQSH
ncbi:deoxyribonuclease V [Chitinophaga agrisoli]|nr:deoxyribonuclease V [Chitinophaga agrisoli]